MAGARAPTAHPSWPSVVLRSLWGHRDSLRGSVKKARLSAQLPVLLLSLTNAAGELKRTLRSISPCRCRRTKMLLVPPASPQRGFAVPREKPVASSQRGARPSSPETPRCLLHGIRPWPRELLLMPQTSSGAPSKLSCCSPIAFLPSRSLPAAGWPAGPG